ASGNGAASFDHLVGWREPDFWAAAWESPLPRCPPMVRPQPAAGHSPRGWWLSHRRWRAQRLSQWPLTPESYPPSRRVRARRRRLPVDLCDARIPSPQLHFGTGRPRPPEASPPVLGLLPSGVAKFAPKNENGAFATRENWAVVVKSGTNRQSATYSGSSQRSG